MGSVRSTGWMTTEATVTGTATGALVVREAEASREHPKPNPA
jgi:hypothetical protein